MQKSKAEKLPAAVAAILREGTQLKAQPLTTENLFRKTVQKDTPIWISETVNGHVTMADGGEILYVPYSEVHVIGEMKKMARYYEGYVEFGAPLVDFPDAQLGLPAGEAPANSLVKLIAHNHEYAQVKGSKKYIAIKDFVRLDALFDKPGKPENYPSVVNKAERELTVFLADNKGKRTDIILQQAKVAIGRRVNPTPVGTFKLGSRQRWRNFEGRYAPFVIRHSGGLYLHGPMHFDTDERAISRNALLEFGQQKTSGCVRVPYDVMLWIYCHCNSSNTVLEIIGGRNKS
jgi:hypothetical protein